MKIFAIKDIKAEGFNTPFCQQTYGLAERAFKDACNDSTTHLYKNKEDFSLYYVGDFDHSTGVITASDPKLVCTAL